MTNIIEKAGSVKVNPLYDMWDYELNALRDVLKTDEFTALVLAFKYGYLKGTRAAKAQQKKERMKDHE